MRRLLTISLIALSLLFTTVGWAKDSGLAGAALITKNPVTTEGLSKGESSSGPAEGPATPPEDPETPIETPDTPATCQTDPIDYECWCEGHWIYGSNVPDMGGLSNILNNYSIHGAEIGGEHLICFDRAMGNVEVWESLDFIRPDEHVIIYGPIIELNGNEGVRLISRGNLSYVYTRIVKSSDLDRLLNPLLITGSDVEIIDSQIEFSGVGVSIAGTEEARIQNILIKNTQISGPGRDVAGSKGISIENAGNVRITDNLDTIRNSDIGIAGAAQVGNTSFQEVNIPVLNPGPVVDTSKAAKVMEDEVEDIVVEVSGKAPVNECNPNPDENGKIDMYILAIRGGSESLHYYTECSITPSENSLCIRPHGMEEASHAPDICPDNYVYISRNECIFRCDVSVERNSRVSFGYRDKNEISYSLSDDIPIDNLGSYSSVPSMPTDIPTIAGVGGDNPATGIPGAGYVEDDPGGSIPGEFEGEDKIPDGESFGPVSVDGTDSGFTGTSPGKGMGLNKMGCSLVINDNHGSAQLIVTSILIFVLFGLLIYLRKHLRQWD